MGCHFLLQGIFLTYGSKLHLLLARWILCHWATREAPPSCVFPPHYFFLRIFSYKFCCPFPCSGSILVSVSHAGHVSKSSLCLLRLYGQHVKETPFPHFKYSWWENQQRYSLPLTRGLASNPSQANEFIILGASVAFGFKGVVTSLVGSGL